MRIDLCAGWCIAMHVNMCGYMYQHIHGHVRPIATSSQATTDATHSHGAPQKKCCSSLRLLAQLSKCNELNNASHIGWRIPTNFHSFGTVVRMLSTLSSAQVARPGLLSGVPSVSQCPGNSLPLHGGQRNLRPSPPCTALQGQKSCFRFC